MSKEKITLAWSGGKDSALALDRIIVQDKYEIDHLHTVIDTDLKRVGLHGVSETLIDEQAKSLGIPLRKLYLNRSQNHAQYERTIADYLQSIKKKGIKKVAYGDIFLEDLKNYRDTMLKKDGFEGIYPLWKEDSGKLINEFLKKGYKTLICAADAKYFNKSQVGKTVDVQFIDDFHDEIDICGENGEFHTFVYDGPRFKSPLAFRLGEVVEKTYQYQITDDDGLVVDKRSTFLFQDIIII